MSEVSSVASSSVSSSVASSVLVSVLVLVLEPEFLDLDLPLFAHSTDKTNSSDKRKIGLMLKDNHALRAINMICCHSIHFDPYLYEMTDVLSCQHLTIGVISHLYSLIYIARYLRINNYRFPKR